jgi:hypothetical protein
MSRTLRVCWLNSEIETVVNECRKALLITWLVMSLAVAASTVGLHTMRGHAMWEAIGLGGLVVAASCVLAQLYQPNVSAKVTVSTQVLTCIRRRPGPFKKKAKTKKLPIPRR